MTKKVHPDRWVWTVGVDDLIEQATEGLYASGCVEGDADFESNLEAEVCDAAKYEWECLYEAIQAWMDKRGDVPEWHVEAEGAGWRSRSGVKFLARQRDARRLLNSALGDGRMGTELILRVTAKPHRRTLYINCSHHDAVGERWWIRPAMAADHEEEDA